MPRFRPGPDPDFPYLDETMSFSFANPAKQEDDIIAVGGNLSPGMLLSAYEQGIFPWYNPGDPVIWQSPDPRLVIFPESLHISKSMKKLLNSETFKVTYNKDFSGVIKGCAQVYRPKQGGTWISQDIIDAYTELHRLGWAHSAEAWQDETLAGGCYGVIMGRAFFGESMFARTANASKTAFLHFALELFNRGIEFIDCQVPTTHLISLGGVEMTRSDFISLLKKRQISRYR